MLTPCQRGWGGKWVCYWWVGGQMLWEASVLEDLYGMKAEPDLTKTQNSQVNNEQKKLVATKHANQLLCLRIKTDAKRE